MLLVTLDPTQLSVATSKPSDLPPAPRLDTLEGKTLGLWNNGKLNSARLLEQIREELEKSYNFDVVRGYYDPGKMMAEDGWDNDGGRGAVMLANGDRAGDLMAEENFGDVSKCDAVILANGDCGACSTSGIVNAIELEKRGIPALLVSTPPFADAVKATAALRNMPDIRWAVVEHPIGSSTDIELRKRAVSAASQFPDIILSGDAAKGDAMQVPTAETSEGSEQITVSGFEEANELFHRMGWTDGLPIIPPTNERVMQFLDAAGLQPDDQLGFYQERQLPIVARKLAANAVMAGCLSEHFPVVVAIVEAMLDPQFMLHTINSSTASFTVGFVVNGPLRHKLGMNCHGNVIGPGNRANSTIGRAIRLIQINVMNSVPGAGSPEPAHGRPALDRSTIGQPAKYAGYHIVENEEAFPSLLPLHVELGFEPGDSTVTVFIPFGYRWIETHAEQTPEAWIDTVAQYVIGIGMLHEQGYGILLIPPENARLFVEAGWTKQDIRDALYERTRRSIAWAKADGWKVAMQRERNEPVKPGDEERTIAIAGSPAPDDLILAVCGGPAGSWPNYIWGIGGPAKPVSRRIRTGLVDGR